MKKYLPMLIAFLFVITTFSSCKKEKETVMPPKDYSISISGKTWWGMLTNAGETAQYYSVYFRTDNTLLWTQLSGDYSGRWSVSGNKLTLTFASPAVVVMADISGNERLENITTNTANKVNSGTIVQNANTVLPYTIWSGTVLDGTVSRSLQISYLANRTAVIRLGTVSYPAYSYQQSESGNAVRIITGSNPYFAVITGSEMNGSAQFSQFPFRLTKQ